MRLEMSESSEIFCTSAVERLKELSGITPLVTVPGRVMHLYTAVRMGRRVVLKVLAPEVRGNDLYSQMLYKEFEIGYDVTHPHIVRTLDFVDTAQFGPAVVVEFVDGITLTQFMASGRMTAAVACRLMLQLCDAVERLHTHGIVHRDLKPDNIMVSADGRNLTLIDLGCSDAAEFDILKMPMGTPRYAAPEMMAPDAEASVAADIYSLGIIARELAGAAGGCRLLRRISRRCTVTDPSRRPGIETVKSILSRRFPVKTLAVIMSLIAVVVLLSVRIGNSTDAPARVDTVYVETVSDIELYFPVSEMNRLQAYTDSVLTETCHRFESGDRSVDQSQTIVAVIDYASRQLAARCGSDTAAYCRLLPAVRETVVQTARDFNAAYPW